MSISEILDKELLVLDSKQLVNHVKVQLSHLQVSSWEYHSRSAFQECSTKNLL